ncbi:hypothetical protein PsAD2_03747 [Pseudovibrio axinellae]|uniref:Uncharacterized protein n=1 Tax=Pseudovibrio axinellae TaxID=989403 RepID=A0A165VM97_9HYPH|nr:hypothetical protein [Pseudovibrio axinellae]KZL14452.1 hypothetical protein PsAD2_03747 [Pseudovibrio axinellae]SER85770.1 hypothetical protein SAMN05421798_1398 [Pseudovibrio axinellae]
MNTVVTLSLFLMGATLPATYETYPEVSVRADGVEATLTRSALQDKQNAHLGGEHISHIVAADGKLLGYARMTKEMAQPAVLPSQEEAHAVAMDVLRTYAPDLLESHRVHWIAPHDETITVNEDGQKKELKLTGMKVKMRATTPDQLWFWVIVGPEKQVMVFERDIFWRTIPGNRRTEKWLHDSWLKKQKSALKQLWPQL